MPIPLSPLTDHGVLDAELVALVQQGDRGALDALIERHRPWIYNLAVRMVYLPTGDPHQGRDQAVDVREVQQPADLALSHRREPPPQHETHLCGGVGYLFERYPEGLDSAPDLDLPDRSTVPADVQLLVDDARIGCSKGMLQCLDRDQWLVHVLGEIFGVSDAVGPDLLEVSRDAFRPVVQQIGDVALLSFNLVSYRTDDGQESAISSWNSTEADPGAVLSITIS